ncbi:MAG: dockerin type I repeat-containing protein, partial [Eubacteriales bacterium]|nr:dockerin type I repeat-containing protein [Eubacteriales bacterium]
NGKPAYVYAVEEASTSKIRVSMDFGECNDTIIENIRIEVTPPKAGEHPDYTARVLGTGYSINTSKNSYYDAYWANQKWYYVKNGVSWWDVTDGGYNEVYDKDVFLPDHKYQCEVHVKTDQGYEFLMNTKTDPPTVPSVIVNGNPGAHTTLYASGLQFEQEVKYVFNCSAQVLSNVGVIELSQPLAGGTPDYVATTLAPHLYDIKSITWYDALGEELPANATFIAGMVYRVAVKIQPIEVQGKKVASFNSDTKASLNGNQLDMISYSNANKEDVEELFSHAYYENNQSIYLYYTFKPAPQPAIGYMTVSGTATSFGSNTDDVTIQLIKSGAAEPAYEAVVKGKTAEYSIEGVSAGTYTLKVMKENHVTREYTVVVGNSSVIQDVKICRLGDVNMDGTVSILDATEIQKGLAGLVSLNEYQSKLADVNKDGSVSVIDATQIQKYIAGIIDKF